MLSSVICIRFFASKNVLVVPYIIQICKIMFALGTFKYQCLSRNKFSD